MKKRHEVRSKGELICRFSGGVLFGLGIGLIVFHTIIVILGLFTGTLLGDIRLFAIGL